MPLMWIHCPPWTPHLISWTNNVVFLRIIFCWPNYFLWIHFHTRTKHLISWPNITELYSHAGQMKTLKKVPNVDLQPMDHLTMIFFWEQYDMGLRSLEVTHLIQPHENSLATLWITGRKTEPLNLTLSASKITFRMISRGYMWILDLELILTFAKISDSLLQNWTWCLTGLNLMFYWLELFWCFTELNPSDVKKEFNSDVL